MKRSGFIAVLALSLGLAAAALALTAAPALADQSPTAWQPVISNSSGTIGTYYTITQPVNVTGVVALLPTTHIPASGAGTLAWDASADTLSWRGGSAVPVSTQTSATYVLPEPSGGASIIVTVTPGALPAADAGDTLTVTSAPASAGLGNLDRDTARGSAVFDGSVYVGLGDRQGAEQGEVWRSADGINWVLAALPDFGQAPGAIHHVDSLIVFNGQLYAGADNGQIWRTPDGSLWTEARPTQNYNANVTDFAIFGGQLFANQANGGPGGVLSSPDGANWTSVFTFGEWQQMYPHDLQVFDGSLFSDAGSYNGILGSGPGAIWSTPDGTDWQQSGTDGFGNPDNTDISGLAVFEGELYAGTFNATQGAEVWRTADGTNWQLVATNGFGDPDNTIIHELVVFDGELYAGTEDDLEGGEIWRSANGTTWSLANVPGFGTGKYERIRSFFELGGYLYANAGNDCTTDAGPGCQEGGWELWRLPSTPPTCSVTGDQFVGSPGDSGAYEQEEVTVQAPGGLASINHISISDGMVSYGFNPGTTASVVVSAVRPAADPRATWSFYATDELGQTTYCG